MAITRTTRTVPPDVAVLLRTAMQVGRLETQRTITPAHATGWLAATEAVLRDLWWRYGEDPEEPEPAAEFGLRMVPPAPGRAPSPGAPVGAS